MKKILFLLFLGALSALMTGASGPELKAGAAKTIITPPDFPAPRVMVMGNTNRKKLNHDLYARALTIFDGKKRLVIVTYDLNCLDVATPILRVRCRDELGIDPAFLIMMGTHNHAAPIQIAPSNYDYGKWLADRIFDLIRAAIADEQGPARVFFGAGDANFLYATGGHKVDPEVQVLKVEVAGKTRAVFMNHATHPMQESFHKLGVGHPGYAVDRIEKKMPGMTALYADACGGNQFSKIGAVMLAPRLVVKLSANLLSDKVMEIMEDNMIEVTGPLTAKLEVIALPLGPPLSYEDALALAEKEGVDMSLGLVPYPRPQREYNWVRNLIWHYEQNIPFPTDTTERVCTDDGFLVRELPEPREFPCVYEETIAARIGELVFVAMQGEVCAPIGRRVKDELRKDGPALIGAYMGEHNLYIPTRELVRQEAYQAKVIQIQYASPVPWSEDVEDVMVESVVEMVRSWP